ncbi:MAG: RsmE family RNA methyltransferase [Pirellula sp.]
MAIPRFLVSGLQSNALVELPEGEANHASRVLRCAVGDDVILFDGRGHEAAGIVALVDKRSVRVNVGTIEHLPRDHDGRLHFAVALPKGDRQKNTIEKLVELGVNSLTPLQTVRGVAQVTESNCDRLVRYIVEACKQCGRNRLMEICPPVGIEPLMTMESRSEVWIVHPSRAGLECMGIQDANRLAARSKPQRLMFLIGPEGGFTDEEVHNAMSSGAKLLSLGDRILRVETAVAAAAVLGGCWLES